MGIRKSAQKKSLYGISISACITVVSFLTLITCLQQQDGAAKINYLQTGELSITFNTMYKSYNYVVLLAP